MFQWNELKGQPGTVAGACQPSRWAFTLIDVHSVDVKGKIVCCYKNSDLYQPDQGSSMLPHRGHGTVSGNSSLPTQIFQLSGGPGFGSQDRTNSSHNNSCKKGSSPKSYTKNFPIILPSAQFPQSHIEFFLSLVSLTSTSIRNYSCHICHHHTLIYQCARQLVR